MGCRSSNVSSNVDVIRELQTAARIVCRRLREKPYQPRVKITAWDAIIDQLLDGRRYGAFSWQNALSKEVKRYIAELDEDTKRRIWESTEDRPVIPNADIETLTKCLYPFVYHAARGPIDRAVSRRERKLAADDDTGLL